MVNKTPAPRPMIVNERNAPTVIAFGAGMGIWGHQNLEPLLDDLQRDARPRGQCLGSHVYHSVGASEDDQLLHRHDCFPVPIKCAVVDRVVDLPVHQPTFPASCLASASNTWTRCRLILPRMVAIWERLLPCLWSLRIRARRCLASS